MIYVLKAPLSKGAVSGADWGIPSLFSNNESLHRYAVPLPLTREAYNAKS